MKPPRELDARLARLEADTAPRNPEEAWDLDFLTVPELKRLEGILVRQESGESLREEDQAWLEQIKQKVGPGFAEPGKRGSRRPRAPPRP